MKKERSSKYELLKVLGISFLVFAVLTWIIPTGIYSGSTYTSSTTSPVGLYGLFINPLYSFGIFAQYIVVFLAIGGLYGVLNQTGVYSKMIEGISNKFKSKKTLFLIITIITFALLSSLFGSQIALFVFVPFAIAILMTLGFDKITSLAATLGSILVGVAGSTYGTGVVFKSFFGMDANNGIVYKIILFVILVVLYIFFILGKEKLNTKKEIIEEVKPKKGRKKKDTEVESVKEEVKKVEIPLYDEKKEEHKNAIPLIVMFILLAVIVLAGMFNWYYTFGIELFSNVYESIMSVKIGEVAVFAKIFGDLPEIGSFGNYDLATVLIIATALIAWVYGVKFNDLVSSYKNGAKKMLLPAIYVMFASIIFAVMVNSDTNANISAAIINFLVGLSDKFNALVVTLIGFVSSYFFNDFPYMVNSVYGALISFDAAMYPVISIILNATYGLAMLTLPVSITLIAGLKYMDISYKEWIKYIWKFLLQVFVLIILFALIVLAIIG